MCTLRRRTQEDINERISNAKATLDQLDTVLAKGNDLQHAAKCVLIADSLHQHGEEIDQTLRQAKTTATQYTATTNGLLARINHALAD
jgi:ABC-type transporter Mla subunit MlaD